MTLIFYGIVNISDHSEILIGIRHRTENLLFVMAFGKNFKVLNQVDSTYMIICVIY